MEVKKYKPLVVFQPTGSTRERSLKPKPKVRPKAKIKLEAGGSGTKGESPLSLENKKKLDIIYARGFVKTSKK